MTEDHRITQMEALLEKISIAASGGLTSFSLAAKHEFLNDIAKLTEEHNPLHKLNEGGGDEPS